MHNVIPLRAYCDVAVNGRINNTFNNMETAVSIMDPFQSVTVESEQTDRAFVAIFLSGTAHAN